MTDSGPAPQDVADIVQRAHELFAETNTFEEFVEMLGLSGGAVFERHGSAWVRRGSGD